MFNTSNSGQVISVTAFMMALATVSKSNDSDRENIDDGTCNNDMMMTEIRIMVVLIQIVIKIMMTVAYVIIMIMTVVLQQLLVGMTKNGHETDLLILAMALERMERHSTIRTN